MRKPINNAILTILTLAFIHPVVLAAGDLPVPDIQALRILILQPDEDLSIFDGEELAASLMVLIDDENGERRDKIVRGALGALAATEDERAVPYLITYMDEFPMDCLYGLGNFSNPESCSALLAHLQDEDQFNRRFAAQSLGELDYTVSDEMWELKAPVLNALRDMLTTEDEDWILPIIEEAVSAVEPQERTGENIPTPG